MEEGLEEEQEPMFLEKKYSPISVCKCLTSEPSLEKPQISARKQQILTTVPRTESYLRERRIPELIRFLMAKLLSDIPSDPVAYLEKLFDDCMLFRAGLGLPPVSYERRHLDALVKSFDPGSRGWLTAAQVRKAFTTLGLPPHEPLEERTPTLVVINELERIQERELFHLLAAGTSFAANVTPSSTSSVRNELCPPEIKDSLLMTL